MGTELTTTETLPLDIIRRNGGTQVRDLDESNVHRLLGILTENIEFQDAPRVWFDGADYWLSHGFHRIDAYVRYGAEKVPVEVLKGTLDDAKDDACKPHNATHGKPETTPERAARVRAYVERHLGDSLRKIGEWCGVSHVAVKNAKEKLAIVKKLTIPEKTTGKGGRQYPAKQKPRKAPENPRTPAAETSEDKAAEEKAVEGLVAITPPPDAKQDDPKHNLTKLFAKNVADCAIADLKRIPRSNPFRSREFSRVLSYLKKEDVK